MHIVDSLKRLILFRRPIVPLAGNCCYSPKCLFEFSSSPEAWRIPGRDRKKSEFNAMTRVESSPDYFGQDAFVLTVSSIGRGFDFSGESSLSYDE